MYVHLEHNLECHWSYKTSSHEAHINIYDIAQVSFKEDPPE